MKLWFYYNFFYVLKDFYRDRVFIKFMSMGAEGKSKYCFWFVVFVSYVNMNF